MARSRCHLGSSSIRFSATNSDLWLLTAMPFLASPRDSRLLSRPSSSSRLPYCLTRRRDFSVALGCVVRLCVSRSPNVKGSSCDASSTPSLLGSTEMVWSCAPTLPLPSWVHGFPVLSILAVVAKSRWNRGRYRHWSAEFPLIDNVRRRPSLSWNSSPTLLKIQTPGAHLVLEVMTLGLILPSMDFRCFDPKMISHHA